MTRQAPLALHTATLPGGQQVIALEDAVAVLYRVARSPVPAEQAAVYAAILADHLAPHVCDTVPDLMTGGPE